MKRYYLSFLLIMTGALHVYSQKKKATQQTVLRPKDVPVLVIDGKDTTYYNEFLAVYNKNSHLGQKQSVEEYMDLFINFKLKVYEAKRTGLDTTPGFLAELKTYRTQLAQPYLNDKEITEKLIQEAYERMQYDVRASHILVKCAEDASPKDTMEAWNRIMAIRNRIVKGNEPFEVVAREVSEDPSVKENGGDLGYFSVFYMVYPFETAAYTTPVGQVSMPVRTRFGYHLVKVTDKRPARGQIKVAHIMVRFPLNASEEDKQKAKHRIDSLYQLLRNGKDFAELAKEASDDKSTSLNGGVLPVFGVGKMVESFENAAFALQEDGEISAPVETPYGWHIIKRIEKYDIKSFEESKPEIKQRLTKDSRSYISKEAFVEKLKKEYNYQEYPKHLSEIFPLVNKDIFEARWKKPAEADKMQKPLFKLADKTYLQKDFIEYLYKMQYKKPVVSIESVVKEYYKDYVKETLLKTENDNLEKKYPEFAQLYKEYYEGILLFNITDREVWSKAVKDTAGLKEFYQQNNTKYMWGERAEVDIFQSKDEKALNLFRKNLLKSIKKNDINLTTLLTVANKKSEVIQYSSGRFEKGENPLLQAFEWIPGVSEVINHQGTYVFIHIKNILPPSPKDLSLVRGAVISEYQQYLEKKWIEQLKSKYSVQVLYENIKNH